MMKLTNIVVFPLILTCLLSYSGKLSCQQAVYYGPDIHAVSGDTLIFRLMTYTGQPQWQYSNDGVDWTDAPEADQDEWMHVATDSRYVRAQVIAGHCDPFYSDTTRVHVTTINELVYRPSEAGLELISTPEQIMNGLFVFTGNLGDRIGAGSFIVDDQGMGYMRRVDDFVFQDGLSFLETSQATLTDIISHISLADSLKFAVADNGKFEHDGVFVPVRTELMKQRLALKDHGAAISLSGLILETEVIDELTSLPVKVVATIGEGEVSFNPWLVRDLDISGQPARLQHAGFAAYGDIGYAVNVTIAADGKLELPSYEEEIYSVMIGPLMIGPVPMYYRYSLNLGLSASFSDAGTVSFQAASVDTVKFGATYYRNQDPEWEGIREVDRHPGNASMAHELHGPATASLSVRPAFEVIVGGVAGPAFSLTLDYQNEYSIDRLEGIHMLFAGYTHGQQFAMDAFCHDTEPFIDEVSERNLLLEKREPIRVPEGMVADYDGNFYPIVEIGGRWWFAENLRAKHYADGRPIPGAYAWENDEGQQSTYGRYYSWFAAVDGLASSEAVPSGIQGACPAGWHIPSRQEYMDRNMALGENQLLAGKLLKSCRQVDAPQGGDCNTTEHPRWDAHNTIFGTDAFGFAALPGGFAIILGDDILFRDAGRRGYWHSTSSTIVNDNDLTWVNAMRSDVESSGFSTFGKTALMPIRCVEDYAPPHQPGLPEINMGEAYDITYHSAGIQAEIVNDGGCELTSYGFILRHPETGKRDTFELGIGTAVFSYNFTGLQSERRYQVYAYAINCLGSHMTAHIEFTTLTSDIGAGCGKQDHVTDKSGHVYGITEIGKQCWMTTNLKTMQYNDGTPISIFSWPSDWRDAGGGGVSWPYPQTYAFDEMHYYGALYNWHAVSHPAGICPAGWRVPTDADWRQLREYIEPGSVSTNNDVGGKLKSINTWPGDHPSWIAPNAGASDDYGFLAVPGGIIDSQGVHNGFQKVSAMWAADADNLGIPFGVSISTSMTVLSHIKWGASGGMSVRCIKE